MAKPGYIRSEFNTENPKIVSINQRKSMEFVEARRRQNLTDMVHDPKDEVRAPSLDFVAHPEIAARS